MINVEICCVSLTSWSPVFGDNYLPCSRVIARQIIAQLTLSHTNVGIYVIYHDNGFFRNVRFITSMRTMYIYYEVNAPHISN